MKEHALELAAGLMGVLALFFACTAAEGDVIEGWIVWYLAALAGVSMLALVVGLGGSDE